MSNYSTTKVLSPRNIALCIVFSIITCGIYWLYWLYKMAEEINIITDNEDDTSPGLVVLFSIITCGIYEIYWAYKVGDKLKNYYQRKGSNNGDNLSILFLILMIANYFTSGISSLVCNCLIQDNINKIVKK